MRTKSATLESVLKDLAPRANVVVNLSSSHDYGAGMLFPDCCGNHYASNWMAAIMDKRLEGKFYVREVKVDMIDDYPQWSVTLHNIKDNYTHLLDVTANAYAALSYLNY